MAKGRHHGKHDDTRPRPAFTPADLDQMPDDGHRYELVDGVLVVSPSPRFRHQRAVLESAVLLRASCPAELEVVIAPFDVVLAEDTVLIPDLLAWRLVGGAYQQVAEARGEEPFWTDEPYAVEVVPARLVGDS